MILFLKIVTQSYRHFALKYGEDSRTCTDNYQIVEFLWIVVRLLLIGCFVKKIQASLSCSYLHFLNKEEARRRNIEEDEGLIFVF